MKRFAACLVAIAAAGFAAEMIAGGPAAVAQDKPAGKPDDKAPPKKDEKKDDKKTTAEAWGTDYEGSSNQLEVYVHRLRNKLRSAAPSKELIRTIQGSGYEFIA